MTTSSYFTKLYIYASRTFNVFKITLSGYVFKKLSSFSVNKM